MRFLLEKTRVHSFIFFKIIKNIVSLAEKHEETWNLVLEEKNNLILELQSAEKMKNEYYVQNFFHLEFELNQKKLIKECYRRECLKSAEYLAEMQKQSDEYNKALMDLSFTREKYKGFSEILLENEV